eukprot:CAMPEP_0119005006 /NCGR_PEP_ID=MMETSP1176-20130426/1476_1 /TAXON_ID=265551 /ORGANISM="Synedropsis recta cf, Strain CCMP1620" /LENGTH=246 /DNA_ID=CAMNT_0006956769 /DNA_START=77 /DNA_END=817 /DNA_ORIENTATION=+
MPHFNRDFDDDLGKQLISVYKQQTGCFSCRKPAPTLRCGECQVVWYCNKECQVKDWKDQHKQLCRIWCDTRAEEDGCKGPVPICMRSCGFIGENSMVQGIKVRRDLFLKEIQRTVDPSEPGLKCSLVAGVIGMLGKIRLVVGAHFLDDDLKKIRVNHVLVHTVHEGEDPAQVNRLYEGSGTLSEASKENVLSSLSEFAALAKDHQGLITSITFGRGLMYIANDGAFQERVQEAAGGPILWIPDVRY